MPCNRVCTLKTLPGLGPPYILRTLIHHAFWLHDRQSYYRDAYRSAGRSSSTTLRYAEDHIAADIQILQSSTDSAELYLECARLPITATLNLLRLQSLA